MYTVRVLRAQLGDYGHFNHSRDFCCEGNLFADVRSLSFKVDITPRQPKISISQRRQQDKSRCVFPHKLYKPLGLSLPSTDEFKSLLVSFSARLTNRYLVTCVVESTLWAGSSTTTYEYNIAKPFVWHRNQDANAVVGKVVR